MVNTDALGSQSELVKVRNSPNELTFEPINYEDILSQVSTKSLLLKNNIYARDNAISQLT